MTDEECEFLMSLCRGDFKEGARIYRNAKDGPAKLMTSLIATRSTLLAKMARTPLVGVDLDVVQIQRVYESHLKLAALGNAGAFEFWLRHVVGRHDLAAAFPQIEAAAQVDAHLRR